MTSNTMKNNEIITQKELKEQLKYDPETGEFVRLTSRGKMFKAGDIAGVSGSYGGGKHYIHICIKCKKYLAHRLAWLYVYGEFPNEIDHKDGCGKNNKLSNLREVTRQENSKNRRRQSNNTSGICGVSWDKRRSSWRVRVNVNSKYKNIGMFETLLDAACARKSANIKFSFYPNHGSDRPL